MNIWHQQNIQNLQKNFHDIPPNQYEFVQIVCVVRRPPCPHTTLKKHKQLNTELLLWGDPFLISVTSGTPWRHQLSVNCSTECKSVRVPGEWTFRQHRAQNFLPQSGHHHLPDHPRLQSNSRSQFKAWCCCCCTRKFKSPPTTSYQALACLIHVTPQKKWGNKVSFFGFP